MAVPLNPTQRHVVEQLGRSATVVEPVADGFGPSLTDTLEGELADVVEHLGGERLFVNKHALAVIHTCETQFLGTNASFAWSTRTARGTVAHKAIQLSVHWRGEPSAGAIVDEALAILVENDSSIGIWLAGIGEAPRAELRGETIDLVSKFLECFPPLKTEWRPVTESPVRVDLFGGLIRLQGKVDLTLGSARGNQPSKVIIDLKTGIPAAQHRDDLRFYALLETIKLGVPPRLLASYYLDAARVEREEVVPALLEAAAARVIDGVRKIVDTTRARRAAAVQTGPSCGWCPLRADCSEGAAYWAERMASS